MMSYKSFLQRIGDKFGSAIACPLQHYLLKDETPANDKGYLFCNSNLKPRLIRRRSPRRRNQQDISIWNGIADSIGETALVFCVVATALLIGRWLQLLATDSSNTPTLGFGP